MAEWSQIMEGNIAHTLINAKHFVGSHAGDLQCSIVLLVRLATYNGVMTINQGWVSEFHEV